MAKQHQDEPAAQTDEPAPAAEVAAVEDGEAAQTDEPASAEVDPASVEDGEAAKTEGVEDQQPAEEPEVVFDAGTVTGDVVRVRFLERNTHPERGTFEPGDETTVNATRARIWREGGVVEIVGEE